MTPLVLGASGFLGLSVIDALCRSGVRPTAGRRRRSNMLALKRWPCDRVLADLDDPAQLANAMADREVVLHLAGHYPRLSTDRAKTLELGIRQTRNVLDAAATAGVRRLVYVSSVATVASNPAGPSTEADVFTHTPGFGVYHDLKWSMEQLALSEDRLEVVTLCPGACLGPWDLRLGTASLLVAIAAGIDPTHPDGTVNLIDVRDVGRAVVAAATHDKPPRRALLSAYNVKMHTFACSLAERYGVAPLAPPLSAADAIALADTEERRCAADGGRPDLSREIADLVVHGTPIDASLAADTFGLSWTPLNDTLDAFDDWARWLKLLPPRGESTHTPRSRHGDHPRSHRARPADGQ